jgi:hypothetical protein
MNVPMVASYVGTFSWIVLLHMKPFFFSRLSQKTLDKYAYTFRITVDELKNIDSLKKRS